MKAVSIDEPFPTLLVTRQPCPEPGCPHPTSSFPNAAYSCAWEQPMVKRFETRSWPCPPALISQPTAFASTKRKPTDCVTEVGDYEMVRWFDGDGGEGIGLQQPGVGWWTDLPLGAIVGSGRITASYPIVDIDDDIDGTCVVRNGDDLWIDHANEFRITRCSDQLPYGDFTPGRYAWLIEDAAPTTERCPWCWGTGFVAYDENAYTAGSCPVCDGAGRCDPIPARGHQRIWNWQPTGDP